MKNLWFWRSWQRNLKWPYVALLVLFAAAMVWSHWQGYRGLGADLQWERRGTVDFVQVPVDLFDLGIFTSGAEVPNFLVRQHHVGLPYSPNSTAMYIMLGLIALALSVLLAALTQLSRFWYLVGTGVLLFYFVNLNHGELGLFGTNEYVGLAVLLLLYLPQSYYWHAFSQAGILTRMGGFMAAALVYGLLLANFATSPEPLAHVVNYGILLPLMITLLFAFTVGHEVVKGFTYITSAGGVRGQKSNGMWHFLVISLLYIGFLVPTFMNDVYRVRWEFTWMNDMLLLSVSAVLGLWGYRERDLLLRVSFPFKPTGAFIYAAMGLVCFGTIGFLYATGNDPMVETVEAAVIFGHISYGFIFILYVLANFSEPFRQGFHIHQASILYKPTRMPYFTYRLAGSITVLVLFSLARFVPFEQAVAGYNNGLGDLFLLEKNPGRAWIHYYTGMTYKNRNHKSTYQLAHMATDYAQDETDKLQYYEWAKWKKHSPQAYANLANIYKKQGIFGKAVSTLHEGLVAFPGEPHLQNNLGIAYANGLFDDSAFYYVDLAAPDDKVGAANRMGLLAQIGIQINGDSLAGVTQDFVGDLPLNTNTQALLNVNQGFQAPYGLVKEVAFNAVLDPLTHAHLANHALALAHQGDTSLLTTLKGLTEVPPNGAYRENLRLLAALTAFGGYHDQEAFSQLTGLMADYPQSRGRYAYFKGLMALDRGLTTMARAFFEDAVSRGYADADYLLGLALLRDGAWAEALPYWESLQASPNPGTASLANEMLSLMAANPDTLANPRQQYLWVHLRHKRLPFENLVAQAKGISNDYFRALALLELTETALMRQTLNAAELALLTLQEGPAPAGMPGFAASLGWYNVRLQLALGNIAEAASVAPQAYTPKQAFWAQYLNALQGIAQGQAGALERLEALARSTRAHNSVILSTAQQMTAMGQPFDGYTVLAEAVKNNPYSKALHKAFALQAASLGLENYAASSMATLTKLLTPEELARFEAYYAQVKLQANQEPDWGITEEEE